MREEHPIDERFGALYDSEADPPGSVRTALASRLGWRPAPVARVAWRSKLIATTMVILCGAAIGLWMNGTGTMDTPDLASADEQGPGAPPASLDDPERSTTDAALSGSGSGAGRGSRENQSTPTAHMSAEGTKAETVRAMGGSGPAPNMTNASPQRPSPHNDPVFDSEERPGTGHKGGSLIIDRTSTFNSMAASNPPDAHPAENIYMDAAYRPISLEVDLPITLLDARPITPDRPMDAARPGAAGSYDYVLPKGTWWAGPYLGIGSVRGGWKGNGTEELQASEQWRSTDQVGLFVGHSWRSGWGMAAGAGVAHVRSLFSHESTSDPQEVLEVDTGWVMNVYNDSPYTVYTWSIDSLVETLQGTVVQSDARNAYTAITVPIMLSWHGMARRIRYGAFGGLTAWIPVRREGLTLAGPSSDTGPTVADLQDERVDARFNTQLHGQIGASLGYSLTECLGLHLEPMISSPLTADDGHGTPWLTRTVLQIRLQYEFRSSPH